MLIKNTLSLKNYKEMMSKEQDLAAKEDQQKVQVKHDNQPATSKPLSVHNTDICLAESNKQIPAISSK